MVRYKIACDIGNIASIDKCIYKINTILIESTGNEIFTTVLRTLHIFNSNVNLKVQANLYSQNEITYNIYRALIDAIKVYDCLGIQKIVADLLEVERDRIEMPLPPPVMY